MTGGGADLFGAGDLAGREVLRQLGVRGQRRDLGAAEAEARAAGNRIDGGVALISKKGSFAQQTQSFGPQILAEKLLVTMRTMQEYAATTAEAAAMDVGERPRQI